MIVFKLIVILLALAFFFGPHHRLKVTPELIQDHLITPTEVPHD